MIPLLKNHKVSLSLIITFPNPQSSKCEAFDCARVENWKKYYPQTFILFMKIGRNLWGSWVDLVKPPNPGEVVVLVKSTIFAWKSSSVRALDE